MDYIFNTMAIFKARKFQMKNGSDFIVRSGVTADAHDLLAQLQRLTVEDTYTIMTSVDEAQNISLSQEEAWIQSHLDNPNKLLLVAEVDSKVIGVVDCACGGYQRTKHIARLGMGVTREFRGQGVGTALMGCLIEWTRSSEQIEKLELHVHTTNKNAYGLYLKMDFKDEHIIEKNLKYGTGDYRDSLLMGLWLKP